MRHRHRLLARAIVCVGFLILGASSAAAQITRFATTAPGNVTVAGNTLGLAKAVGANGPGLLDSIGTFVTTNALLSDSAPLASPAWPSGTTSSWPLNGSTASLGLPTGATVLYAELVWAGSTNYVEDVRALLDTPIGLSGPSGSCGAVAPDPATAATISEMPDVVSLQYYMRTSDVTACVTSQGAGTWTASGIPATQHESINSLNAAGWGLIVAYEDPTEPPRSLRVIVDGTMVHELASSSILVSGLDTPTSGIVTGRLVAVALEGDATVAGDQLRIRPDGAGFVALSGPNNLSSNFFASQINDATGILDPSGSFGSSNHPASVGQNASGGRQGFDTTGIALSSTAGHLATEQSSAEISVETTGDAVLSLAYGLAVDRATTAVPSFGPIGLLLLAILLAVILRSNPAPVQRAD